MNQSETKDLKESLTTCTKQVTSLESNTFTYKPALKDSVDLSGDLTNYRLLDFNWASIKQFPTGKTAFMTFAGLRLFLITGGTYYDLLLASNPIAPKVDWKYVDNLYQILEDTLYENLLGKPEYKGLTVSNSKINKALDSIWLEIVRNAIKRL